MELRLVETRLIAQFHFKPIWMFNIICKLESVINVSDLSVLDILVIKGNILAYRALRVYKFLWQVGNLAVQKDTPFNLLHRSYQHVHKAAPSLSLLA